MRTEKRPKFRNMVEQDMYGFVVLLFTYPVSYLFEDAIGIEEDAVWFISVAMMGVYYMLRYLYLCWVFRKGTVVDAKLVQVDAKNSRYTDVTIGFDANGKYYETTRLYVFNRFTHAWQRGDRVKVVVDPSYAKRTFIIEAFA